VEVSRDDTGQCNRVIDKYKLIGKFTLLEIAYRVLEVIHRETVSISYIGLTSLSLHQRMHTHSAAHFPNKGRSIFWICTARSDVMRVAEGKLVQILRQHNVRLQNSYSSSLSGAGIGAQNVDAMIDLYLLSDSFNGHCPCHFCIQWSFRINVLKRQVMRDEQQSEGHYYWFKRPLEETHAAGDIPVTSKRLRSDNHHRDHEAGGIPVTLKRTIDSQHRCHVSSMLARRLFQEQTVEHSMDKIAKQDTVTDNDRWMNILEGNFKDGDNVGDSVQVQPTEIDDSTSE
jgi:hypothetical protein